MMKYFAALVLCQCLLMSTVLGQSKDTTPTQSMPMLGYVNINGGTSSINTGSEKISIGQAAADINIPLYKNFKAQHPHFTQLLLHYDGLFISDNSKIGSSNNFHSISATLMQTISISKTTNMTFIAMSNIASDFKQDLEGRDIMYGAGVRMGFHQNKNLKYGVTLMYINSYAGRFLIPLPDIDWQINDRWNLSAFIPAIASLKYKISDKQSLGLATGLNATVYGLNDSAQHKQYIQFQQYNLGFVYDINLGKHWKINLNAGRTLMQKLETFSTDQKVSFEDFGSLHNRISNVSYKENSFFIHGGISYRF